MMFKNGLFSIGAALVLATAAGSVSAQCLNPIVTQGNIPLEQGFNDLGIWGDDITMNVALPFNVTYYGVSYNSINVCSNGWASFTSTNTAYSNTCLPQMAAPAFNRVPGPTIYAHWDDLYTGEFGQGVFTSTSGSPGSQVFNIEWRADRLATEIPLNFSIRIHENGTIDLVYASIPENGASATAGLQDGQGNFYQITCDAGGLSSGTSYTFSCAPPTNPSGAGGATPNLLFQGGSTLLTVNVLPAAVPPSTGLGVTANLSAIGGSSSQMFYDNGTNGDAVAGDNVFSYLATVPTSGTFSLPFTVTDAQSRSGTGNINFTAQQVINLATLPNGTTTSTSFDIPAGRITWLKLTIPEVSDFSMRYLDMYTNSSADTEFGLYTASGSLVANDDDDGAGATSAMSFGINTPTRPPVGDSAIFDSRDGDLMAGTYYLAVGTYNTTFNANNFSVTSTGPAAFGVSVTMVMGTMTDPYLVGNAASGSVGGNVLLTANVTAGIDPPSSSLTVRGDLSTVGGSSTQLFYDDGTHGDVFAGDNVYSYLAAIPHAPAQAPGTYTLPVSVIDNLGRGGNHNIVLALSAEAIGSCCTAGACSITTAFNCAAGGGAYNGDGSTCTGSVNNVGTSGDFFPLTIPQPSVSGITPGSVTSSLYVPSGSGTINNNLAVVVGLNHTWMGDVRLALSNGIQSVDLVYRPGVFSQTTETGYMANFGGTYVFSDGAPGDLWAAGNGQPTEFVIPSGHYFPTTINGSPSSLSAFNGMPFEGSWTLTAEDWWTIDAGTVVSFALATVTPVDCNQSTCGTSDFDGDGDYGTDFDIESFFACLAGNCCATCWHNGSDFNGDGDYGTDADIEAFFRVLAGGNC